MKKTHVPQCSLKHYLQKPGHGSNMFTDRWMDKEDAVHILFSHTKELIWVSCSKVDEPRAYYTEWSKSERERQVLYINACVWNLKKYFKIISE